MSEERKVPSIERAEVARIARLAQLDLDDATAEALTHDLQSILDHVGVLDELDVGAVEPTASGIDAEPTLREDVPRASLSNEEALANAPDAGAGHFRVPRVLDE